MSTMNIHEMTEEEMNNMDGGMSPLSVSADDNCPVYGSSHHYKATGESRKTDAWFYKTEEHYKCACGKGYWEAGCFCIRKYDN